MPLELMRWTIAERFGWTLEQVDALKISDLNEYLQILDGREKHRQSKGK
jgi:hypothetical protein